MKKYISLLLALCLVFLSGCTPLEELADRISEIAASIRDAVVNQPDTESDSADAPSTEPLGSEPPETNPPETKPPVTEPPVTEPPVTEPPEPLHSDLYIPGFSADDVIRYFNEVCLDAEFSSGPGDSSLLQRWETPITYYIHGTPTEKDQQVLTDFVSWLNTIPGFPGMRQVLSEDSANTQIYFCTKQELIDRMGSNFSNADGAVTFWYDQNVIFKAEICYRTDIGQYVRNSVILEEIYNGLGPVQDTTLRTDSIIYSGYSTPQKLTAMDELLLKLLYHPALSCGMNAEQCAAVIRTLYY